MHNYLTEQQLLSGFNTRQDQAVIHIYHLFFDRLRGYAYKLTDHKQDSEDIAIAAFYNLLVCPIQFNSIAHIKGYLNGCVYNHSLNCLRRRRLNMKLYKYYSYQNNSEIDEEKVNSVVHAIEHALSPKLKYLVIKSFISGLDNDQLSVLFKTTNGSIRTQKARAISRIRKYVYGSINQKSKISKVIAVYEKRAGGGVF